MVIGRVDDGCAFEVRDPDDISVRASPARHKNAPKYPRMYVSSKFILHRKRGSKEAALSAAENQSLLNVQFTNTVPRAPVLSIHAKDAFTNRYCAPGF
jgi:hypothetical protein